MKAAIFFKIAINLAFLNHSYDNNILSPENIALAVRLVEGGKIIGIHFMDYMICTWIDYCSLKE